MPWKALSLVLICTAAVAQPAGKLSDAERAARPDNASNARVGGWCDALTGEKKEKCLREERRRKPGRTATPQKKDRPLEPRRAESDAARSQQ
jgi:hypothetical protein